MRVSYIDSGRHYGSFHTKHPVAVANATNATPSSESRNAVVAGMESTCLYHKPQGPQAQENPLREYELIRGPQGQPDCKFCSANDVCRNQTMIFVDPRSLPCQISRQRAKFNDRARTLFHPSAACSPPIYPLGPPPNGLAALARLGWNDLRMALRHSVGGEGTTKQQKRAPSLTLWAASLTQ